MKRIHTLLYLLAICFITACHKENDNPSLPPGSVSIQLDAGQDTLAYEVSVLKDSIIIVGLHAELDGQAASADHVVTFRTDSTRLLTYRDKYGDATLLPYSAYFFYRFQGRIPAGAVLSDSIQLNLVNQSSLKPKTTYVLPVVINNVDGNMEAMEPGQVLYIVVKTKEIPPISKANWSIVSASSQLGNFKPENVLDNNDEGTYWVSAAGQPMPQHVVIDFGSEITFRGVTYHTPALFYTLPSVGGFPLEVKIEVSNDGSTWVDKGSFNGVTTPVTASMDIGATSARYLKFSVLEAQLYSNGTTKLTVIGGIGLVP